MVIRKVNNKQYFKRKTPDELNDKNCNETLIRPVVNMIILG